MPLTPRLKLGTRRSPLAMAQAEEARARLCAAHGWEEGEVELVPVVATGDMIQDRPLAEIGGKALWTRELDIWLAEKRIHAAVHSLKDVETIRPESLVIAAVLPRADKRDRLLGADSLADLPEGAVIGTSAPRRAAQALHVRPDCRVVSLRGNVATRRAKLELGEVDATFLAAAGLDRLGQHDVGRPLDPTGWLPAPSQGAIAMECLTHDAETREFLSAIDHLPSHAEVAAERRLLLGLGGTCHSPIGVLCDFADEAFDMRAAIYSPDGAERVEAQARFGIGDIDAPLAMADDLLTRAAPSIRAVFEGRP